MGQIAILSYHGWEIDPARLIDDVTSLREAGWRDCALADVEAMVTGARPCDRNYFHVTLDDGAEQDLACVDALGHVSCAATLLVSLDAMSDAARAAYRAMLAGTGAGNVAIGDHSLRHHRTFHSRRVIGFHCDEAPLMTSPDRLGLKTGDPVCAYGGELARPCFVPDPRVSELCRRAVVGIAAAPGTAEWTEALSESLLAAGLGFRRLGRLCAAGRYETREQFRARIEPYLLEGRDRLAEFTGRAPIAFAHPWWQPSPTADECLLSLGYRLTFSGQGVWRHGRQTAIPRLFVANDTVRPLAPDRAAASSVRSSWAAARELGRRALWA